MDRLLGFFDPPMLVNLAMQLCNTAILSFVLYKLLYKPVKEFLKKRSERIGAQIQSAEKDFRDAQASKAEYEKKLREIDKERITILETARKLALEKEEQIIARANEEATKLKKRASLDIEREKEKTKDEIKKQMIEISTLISSRYLSENLDAKRQNQLLDNAIQELGDVKWLN